MKPSAIPASVSALLRRNLSFGQLTGYVLSNVIGLTVVLSGIMFFLDSAHSTEADSDSYFSQDFIVVSKRVSGIGFTPQTFDDEEIARLAAQPWVKKVGRFTSSQYAVNGAISLGGRGLSSYMFFESVPDEFFDVKPRDWGFDPEERFVPVILNKDYLTLYNFGFAVPQGLPQVSESLVGAVPVTLRLTGTDGHSETFRASVVGFSSRLNTIAVPQEFMDWANARFAPGESSAPSRLILEIDRLADSDMQRYLDEEELEVGGDKDSAGNVSKFLSAASLVVTTNGLLISVLAVFILILSIFLLLQKSREKLRNLMLLGYSPSAVSVFYERLVIIANLIVTLLAVGGSLMLRRLWADTLAELGLGAASPVPMLLTALGYLVVVTAINILIIRRHLQAAWHQA